MNDNARNLSNMIQVDEEMAYDADAFLDEPTDADVTDKSFSTIVESRHLLSQLTSLLPAGSSDGRLSPDQCAKLRESLVRSWSQPEQGQGQGEGDRLRGRKIHHHHRSSRPVEALVDSRVLLTTLVERLYGLGASYARFLLRARLLNAATAVQTCQLAFEAWINDHCTQEEVEEFLKYFDGKFEPIFKVASFQRTYLLAATAQYKNLADTLLSSRTEVTSSFRHMLLATSCLKNRDEKRAFAILNALVKQDDAYTSDKTLIYASLCKVFNMHLLNQLDGRGSQKNKERGLKLFDDFMNITTQLKLPGMPQEEKERLSRIFAILKPDWKVTETEVSPAGQCDHCKKPMEKEVIAEKDFVRMKVTVMNSLLRGKDVFMASEPAEMKYFLKTLAMNKPFDMVFDGLNIALSRNGRSLPPNLRCKKLIHFVEEYKRRYNVKKACVVLRRHLAKGCPVEFGLLQRIACVISLSDSSIDDPFILYSTLASGPDCLMVSKDRFEDLLNLMGPKPAQIFRRWLRCRQIQYDDSPLAQQHFPDPVGHAIICQSQPEGYHIPLISKEAKNVAWLCIHR